MLSPMLLEISSKVSVLDCIWCLVCDIKARSSAKSRSSNCIQGVHCTPHFSPLVLSLRIQSAARVKRKGESRHPCLTPVLIWKGSESCPSCDTINGLLGLILLLPLLLLFLIVENNIHVYCSAMVNYRPTYQILNENNPEDVYHSLISNRRSRIASATPPRHAKEKSDKTDILCHIFFSPKWLYLAEA